MKLPKFELDWALIAYFNFYDNVIYSGIIIITYSFPDVELLKMLENLGNRWKLHLKNEAKAVEIF